MIILSVFHTSQSLSWFSYKAEIAGIVFHTHFFLRNGALRYAFSKGLADVVGLSPRVFMLAWALQITGLKIGWSNVIAYACISNGCFANLPLRPHFSVAMPLRQTPWCKRISSLWCGLRKGEMHWMEMDGTILVHFGMLPMYAQDQRNPSNNASAPPRVPKLLILIIILILAGQGSFAPAITMRCYVTEVLCLVAIQIPFCEVHFQMQGLGSPFLYSRRCTHAH